MIKQANPLNISNAEVNNVDKQFFERRLEVDTTIKSLATLIIYNWQLTNAIDSFAFLVTLYIRNNIKYTN